MNFMPNTSSEAEKNKSRHQLRADAPEWLPQMWNLQTDNHSERLELHKWKAIEDYRLDLSYLQQLTVVVNEHNSIHVIEIYEKIKEFRQDLVIYNADLQKTQTMNKFLSLQQDFKDWYCEKVFEIKETIEHVPSAWSDGVFWL